jgi:hypothetical protein
MIKVQIVHLSLAKPKTCSACQKVHERIPSGARFLEDEDLYGGWYWECRCHTTLFVQTSELEPIHAEK